MKIIFTWVHDDNDDDGDDDNDKLLFESRFKPKWSKTLKKPFG